MNTATAKGVAHKAGATLARRLRANLTPAQLHREAATWVRTGKVPAATLARAYKAIFGDAAPFTDAFCDGFAETVERDANKSVKI